MEKDAPLVIEDMTTTELGERTDNRSNIATHFRYELGDLEKGFAEADLVVEREFDTTTVHQGYIEPQNAAALWNADGKDLPSGPALRGLLPFGTLWLRS